MCKLKLVCCSLAGYIDLSKRRVSPEEIQKCEEKYSKAKTVSFYFTAYYNITATVINLINR